MAAEICIKITAMKTTLTFILLTGLSILAFCQTKTNATNTVKTKPASTTAKTTTASKHTKPAKVDKTKKDTRSCNLEKQYMPHQDKMVYACPKCSYESQDSGTGRCPKDSCRLKYQQKSIF